MVSELIKDRVGLGKKLYDLDTSKLSDTDLKLLCSVDLFHPGTHGIPTMKRCVELGKKFTLDDALDILRETPLAQAQEYFAEMKFDIPDGTQVMFCPKDPDVLKWLRSFCKVSAPMELVGLAVIEGYTDCLKYIIDNSDDPSRTRKFAAQIAELQRPPPLQLQ